MLWRSYQRLYLDGTAIKELPSSINKLTGLTILDLSGCRELKSLPSSIHMGSLQTLNLSGCSNLEKFPDISDVMEKLRLSCHGWKEMMAPFSSWSTSMEDCSHRGLVHLDLSDCNVLELSGIAHLSSLKTLDLCRNNFETLPAEMNRLHRLTDVKLEGCKRLKSIPELSSSISFIDAHDCTALESVSRPKLLYRNLFFTFSNCFQLVQNLFEYIVEANQVSLSLSLSLSLPLPLPLSLSPSPVRKYETYLMQVQFTFVFVL